MRTIYHRFIIYLFFGAVSFLSIGCANTSLNLGAEKSTPKTEKPTKEAKPVETVRNDPEARAIQVAWTSARATKCGFYFDQNKLRQSFLTAEKNSGLVGDQLKKVQLTYDYTFRSITIRIKDNPVYCGTKAVENIRKDLNRHLAGDYKPSPKPKKSKT